MDMSMAGLPDDVWMIIIRIANKYCRVTHRLLRISKHMNKLVYACMQVFVARKYVSDEIIAKMINMNRVIMRRPNNAALFKLVQLQRMHLQLAGDVNVDLSVLRLTRLTISGCGIITGIPLTLHTLCMYRNHTMVDLREYTRLTDLDIGMSANVQGMGTMTQLQRLCGDKPACKQILNHDITAMTRLHTLEVQYMLLADLPMSLISLNAWACGSVSLGGLRSLQKLTVTSTLISSLFPMSLTKLHTSSAWESPSIRELTNLRGLAASSHIPINDILSLTQLESLSLSAGVYQIDSIGTLTRLRDLVIGNIPSGCIDSIVLLPCLRSLSLNLHCKMNDQQLQRLTALTRLSVRDACITHESISMLTALTRLTIPTDMDMHDFTMLTQLKKITVIGKMSFPKLVRLPLSIELFTSFGCSIPMCLDKSREFVTLRKPHK